MQHMQFTEQFKGESIWAVERKISTANPEEFVASRKSADGTLFEGYRNGAVLPELDENGRKLRVWFEPVKPEVPETISV